MALRYRKGEAVASKTLAFCLKACLFPLCAGILLLPVVAPTTPAGAQILGAAERAAARAAARRAERAAVERSVARSERVATGNVARREAADFALRRWTPNLRGPLPNYYRDSFRSGTYTEKRLGRDTTFYRVYERLDAKYGDPGRSYAFWSRSDARGTKAIIDSAIPVLGNGNTASRQVAITLPRGTRVFEGIAGPWREGKGTIVGGGNQVVIERSVLRSARR
jgi:hypothetical protein